MKPLLAFFIDRHKAFLFLIVLSALSGLSYFSSGTKDILAVQDSRIIEIKSQYPGATPLEIEGLINTPIETFLETIKGYQQISSYSTEGSGRVLFQVDPGYNGSVTEIIEEIRSAIKRISYFPDDMDKKPIVSLLSYYRDPFFYIAIHGKDQLSNINLSNILMDAVRRIPGVATVESIGFDEMEIWVEANPEKLKQYDITMAELKNAIQKRNINLTGGKIKTDGVEFLIRTSKEYKSLQEIEETVVSSNDYGNSVKVQDIAKVTWRPKKVNLQLSNNGEPAIFLSVYKTDSSDVLALDNDIKSAVAKIKQDNPAFSNKNVSVDYIKDKTKFLSNRYHLLIFFFLSSFALTLILFTLYRGIAFAFWAFISFFSSLGITFLLMRISSVSFNLVTLYILFLSNIIFQYASLVVLKEFFMRDISNLTRAQFSEKIAYFSPPFFSTLFMFVGISLCFLYFSGESIGIFHIVFEMILFVSLTTFVINFLFLPSLYFSFQYTSEYLKNKKFEILLNRVGDLFLSISQFFLKNAKKVFIYRFVAIILVCLIALLFLPQRPFLDRSQTINISLLFPSFYSSRKTAEETLKIVENLKDELKNKDYQYYSTFNSLSPLDLHLGQTRHYWSTISIETPHPINGSLIKSINSFMTKHYKEYGLEKFNVEEDLLYRKISSSTIKIRLLGNNLKDFYAAKDDILPYLSKISNLENIESFYDTGLESFLFHVDDEKATKANVLISDVAAALSDSFQGSKVTTTNGILSKGVDIRILFDQNKLEFKDMDDFQETFEHLYVTNTRGESIPIKSFTNLVKDVSYPFIERISGQRVMDIDLYPSGSNLIAYLYNLNSLYQNANKEVSTIKTKYPNIIFKVTPNIEPLEKTSIQSLFFFISSIFIAFFVLVALLKSYSIAFSMIISTITTTAVLLVPLILAKFFSLFLNIPEMFYTFNFFFLILTVTFACLSIANTALLHYEIARFCETEKEMSRAVALSVEKRNPFFSMQFLYFLISIFLLFIFSFFFYDTLMTYIAFLMLIGIVGTQISTLTYPVYYLLSLEFVKRFHKKKGAL